jgi:hypothetical protein
METTHIRFCLTDLLRAVSPALDAGARPQAFVSPHRSRQVAYIALRVARLVFLSERECADLVALALLRDIGISHENLTTRRHTAVRVRNICVCSGIP